MKSLSLDGTNCPVTMHCKLQNLNNKEVLVYWRLNDSKVTLANCTFNGAKEATGICYGNLLVEDEFFDITFEDTSKVTFLGIDNITFLGKSYGNYALLLNPEVLGEFYNLEYLVLHSNNIPPQCTIDLESLTKIKTIALNVGISYNVIPPHSLEVENILSPNSYVFFDFTNCGKIIRLEASPKENMDIANLTCQENLTTFKGMNPCGFIGDISWFGKCKKLVTLALCGIVNETEPTRLVPDMYGDVALLPKTITKFVIGNQPNIIFSNIKGNAKIFDHIDVWNSKRYYMKKDILTNVLEVISLSDISSTSKICLYGDVPVTGDALYERYNAAMTNISSRTTNLSVSSEFKSVENYNI